jgi:nitrogen PTS system EIIA component
MPYRCLNQDEAAQYLNLHRSELDQLVKDREIPFENRGGRVLFRRQALDEWGSQRILSATPKRLAAYHQEASERTRARLQQDALLGELIRPGQIDAALPAKTKSSVIREMVALAARTGWVSDPAELVETLQAREALCSTGVPGGVAFLHPRAQQAYRFDASFVVLGRTVHPIPYGSPDGRATDLFFLLCFQDDKLHLHTLARLCLMALKANLLDELRSAEDRDAMYEVLIAAEQDVISTLRQR